MMSVRSISIEVGLLSGRTVALEAGPDELVGALSMKAQKALAVGRGRLFDTGLSGHPDGF